MADSKSGFKSGASAAEHNEARQEFIDNIIANADPYAATTVSTRVIQNVHELLAGPDGMSEQAQKDFEEIKAILARHGISG